MLIQEFDIVIRDKKGSENVVAYHLSQSTNEEVIKEETKIRGELPDEFLLQATTRPWFVDVANHKAT